MKSSVIVTKAGAALVGLRAVVVATVVGVLGTLQLAGLSTPAHAIKVYADQTRKPCSFCHARSGLLDGTMLPLTSTGAYYKKNNSLPASGNNPPPYNPPPPPYNPPQPPYNPPQPPYNPPQPPNYTPPAPPYNPPYSGNLTCREAKTLVRQQGYRNIVVKDCRGTRYSFHALKRGVWYSMKMRASSGRIYRVRRLGYNQRPPGYTPPPIPGQKLTCREAIRVVRSHGYRRVQATDCRGRNYKFKASRRGIRYRMRMVAATGRLFQVRAISSPGYTPPPVIRGKLSCNQAIASARAQGYRNVSAHNCTGSRYTLHATRNGVRYRLRMRASSGKIYKATRR